MPRKSKNHFDEPSEEPKSTPMDYPGASESHAATKHTKCPECGGTLNYEPGTTHLKCPYCAAEFPIEQKGTLIRESDYRKTIADLTDESATRETFLVKCGGCGAEIQLGANVTSDVCPYCATTLIVDRKVSKRTLKPRYILPFHVGAKQTADLFRNWIDGLWFAPGSLKKLARKDSGITGIYVPYWTYDAATDSSYTGARGDFYYEPETVLVERNGKMVQETRMVQKIAWTPAEGTVDVAFDDVLILASPSLRNEYAQALEPWDLNSLVEFDDRYLSGFLSESYQIGPAEGFEQAKERMAQEIAQAIRADIGGDLQQIHSVDTNYRQVTLKHVLLPVWINSYRYGNKVYSFLVNARTGEVQGDRPWSWIKITLFAIGVAAAAYGFSIVASQFQ